MPRLIGLRNRCWLVLLLVLAGCSGDPTRTPVGTPTPTLSAQVIPTPTLPTPGPPTASIATPVATPTRALPTIGPVSPSVVGASPTVISELRNAGVLIYLGQIDGKEGIVAVHADGSGRRLAVEGRYEYLLWAPDGSRFAAVTAFGPGSTSQQVVIFSDGGRELGRHTFDGLIARDLQWAADSRRLLGASLAGRIRGPISLFGVDAWILDERDVRPIAVPQDNVISYFSWLADGRVVLASYVLSTVPTEITDLEKLSAYFSNLRVGLWTTNTEGQEARKVYEGPQAPFGVAGDGATVFSYTTNFITDDDIIIPELFGIDLTTGQARPLRRATELAARVFGSAPGATDATFSPPGGAAFNVNLVAPKTDRIAFYLGSDHDPQPLPTNPRMLNEALVVLDASGGLVYSARIPRDNAIGALAWSPDGEKLAYLLGVELHILDPVAGLDRSLRIGGAARDFSLAWSPDGRWIAYGGAGGLVVVSVEVQGRSYQLDQTGTAPAWQPVPQQKRLGER